MAWHVLNLIFVKILPYGIKINIECSGLEPNVTACFMVSENIFYILFFNIIYHTWNSRAETQAIENFEKFGVKKFGSFAVDRVHADWQTGFQHFIQGK